MGELFTNPETDMPSLHVALTPASSFENGSPSIHGLHVAMTAKTRPGRFNAMEPFLWFELNQGPTETARYDGDAITACTSSGTALPLRYEDSEDGQNGIRKWYFKEAAPSLTTVIVSFFAPARKTDSSTPMGPRIDLRKDVTGLGLEGMGAGFLPLILDRSGKSDVEKWNVTVEWRLQDAQDGTRAACSLGDDTKCMAQGTMTRLLSRCVFCVGQIRRYPEWGFDEPLPERNYAMYWFGEPHMDMGDLSVTTGKVFRAIATFFSAPNDFRVFVRKVHQGEGGTGATDSFVLEYSDESRGQSTPDDVIDLLAHETVHEYALLQIELKEGQQEPEAAWYVESIANYYGAIATYKGGAISRRQLLYFLNGYASAYYTSPVINMDYNYALSHIWESIHVHRLSYYRGFMYMAAENARIKATTNGAKSNDDVNLELYRRRVAGETHNLDTYHALMADIIGEDAEKTNYQAMLRGDLIVPAADCFANLGIRLIRKDAEQFELGFDLVPAGTVREVKNLIKGSRADKAGIREGDKVVRGWMPWIAADHVESMMRVLVDRGDGNLLPIDWWPRSHDKVQCYIWVEGNDSL